MSEPHTDPDRDPDVDAAPERPAGEITTGRRMLWLAGGGIGAYMVLRGVWGLATGEDQEQP
ncbi:hypothetical protein [Tessaracoccus flavus]|uniref:Uncharacterized protein n=1 Tax=Tessaracoccus flavus TaxID=1610493 RepID=A0A1Q2CGE0_9ACTN|nr:hypothetical protein [Tessaracoccus flavus]AQP45189.1 hypothetical protein RPIT_10590 [Tessaracoccus flavus]SDY53705.1 hypothetical protein SAMN05428934_102187 [Tessaracoccus flavus]